MVMTARFQKPGESEIWGWLGNVPDPEIPVVSVVELGIVRAIDWEHDELVITVTPTYSGCPATSVISQDIEDEVRRHGIECVRIRKQLSPAWTTDWMSADARSKLEAFGIAPPLQQARCAGECGSDASAKCPRCGSVRTEQVSRFGSTPCKASWRCKDCLEPFDYFKRF